MLEERKKEGRQKVERSDQRLTYIHFANRLRRRPDSLRSKRRYTHVDMVEGSI